MTDRHHLTPSQIETLNYIERQFKKHGTSLTKRNLYSALAYTTATVRKAVQRLTDINLVASSYNTSGEQIFYPMQANEQVLASSTTTDKASAALPTLTVKSSEYFFHAAAYVGLHGIGELNGSVKVQGSIHSLIGVRNLEAYILKEMIANPTNFKLREKPNRIVLRNYHLMNTLKSKESLEVESMEFEQEESTVA